MNASYLSVVIKLRPLKYRWADIHLPHEPSDSIPYNDDIKLQDNEQYHPRLPVPQPRIYGFLLFPPPRVSDTHAPSTPSGILFFISARASLCLPCSLIARAGKDLYTANSKRTSCAGSKRSGTLSSSPKRSAMVRTKKSSSPETSVALRWCRPCARVPRSWTARRRGRVHYIRSGRVCLD